MITSLLALILGLVGGFFGHDVIEDVADTQTCESYIDDVRAEVEAAGAVLAGVQGIPGGQIVIFADVRGGSYLGYAFVLGDDTSKIEAAGFSVLDKCVSPAGLKLTVLFMSKPMGEEAGGGPAADDAPTAQGK